MSEWVPSAKVPGVKIHSRGEGVAEHFLQQHSLLALTVPVDERK